MVYTNHSNSIFIIENLYYYLIYLNKFLTHGAEIKKAIWKVYFCSPCVIIYISGHHVMVENSCNIDCKSKDAKSILSFVSFTTLLTWKIFNIY